MLKTHQLFICMVLGSLLSACEVVSTSDIGSGLPADESPLPSDPHEPIPDAPPVIHDERVQVRSLTASGYQVVLPYTDVNGDKAQSCAVSNPSNGALLGCTCDTAGVCRATFIPAQELIIGFTRAGGFDFNITANGRMSNSSRLTVSNEYSRSSVGDLQIPLSRLEDWEGAGVPGGIPDTTNWPTINVEDFGAKRAASAEPSWDAYMPNPRPSIIDYSRSCWYREDGDFLAIQKAINSAQPGTVVLLPAGQYEAWYTGDIADRGSGIPGADGKCHDNSGQVIPHEVLETDGRCYIDLPPYNGTIGFEDGNHRGGCEVPALIMKRGVVLRGMGATPDQTTIITNRKTNGLIQFNGNLQRIDLPKDSTKFLYGMTKVGVGSDGKDQFRNFVNGDCDHVSMQASYPTSLGSGVENIQVTFARSINEAPGYYSLFRMYQTNGNWLKRVWGIFGDNGVLNIDYSSYNTIESSRFALTKFNAPTSESGTNQEFNSHLIALTQGSSNNLVWDNLLEKNEQQIKVECSANHNVVAYNYFREIRGGWKVATMFHGGYTFKNLLEGNKVEDGSFISDDWWGMNGGSTFYRNELVDSNRTSFLASLQSHNNYNYPGTPLASEYNNYLLNVMNAEFGGPYCTPPVCKGFMEDQSQSWSEKNRALILSTPYFGATALNGNTMFFEPFLCSMNPAGCQGFLSPRVKTADCNGLNDPNGCHKQTGFDASVTPSTWKNLSFPDSLFWFQPKPPSFWCLESPWPATGADLYESAAPLPSLPAERKAKGLSCTTSGGS